MVIVRVLNSTHNDTLQYSTIRSFAQHKIMEERNEILKISLAALMRRLASTLTRALAKTKTDRKKNKNCHASQTTDYMRYAIIKNNQR